MKILKFSFLILLSIPFFCIAQMINYNSYEQFYLTLPNRLYEKNNQIKMFSSFSNDGVIVNYWNGSIDNKNYSIEIAEQNIMINQHKIEQSNFKLFKNEQITESTLAMNAILYTSTAKGFERLICIQGNLVSSSGWESRNNTIYLIDLENKILIKPSSLFSSCLSIQKDEDNNILFPHFVYYLNHTALVSAMIQGSIIEEQRYLRNKGIFEDTGFRRFIKYPNQHNNYEFYELQ